MSDLLGRAWIGRVWTYQELLLSPSPVLVCGRHHLPWSEFVWALVLLEASGWRNDPTTRMATVWLRLAFTKLLVTSIPEGARTGYEVYKNPRIEDVLGYQEFVGKVLRRQQIVAILSLYLVVFVAAIPGLFVPDVRTHRWFSFMFSLLWFLFAVGFIGVGFSFLQVPIPNNDDKINYLAEGYSCGIVSRSARNPKDMYIGVRAVLQERSKQRLLAPDYTKTVGELYRELTLHLFPYHNIALLSIAAMKPVPKQPSLMPEQPSWVIDWSGLYSELDVYYPHRYLEDDRAKFPNKPYTSVWPRPSGSDNLSWSDDFDAVQVHGLHMGKITSIHQFHLEDDMETQLTNLASILAFTKGFETIEAARKLHQLYLDVYPPALDQLCSPDFKGIDTPAKNLTMWMEFLYKRRRQDPSLILMALQHTRWDFLRRIYDRRRFPFFALWSWRLSPPRQALQKTHQHFLRYLAETKQKLFWCKLDGPRDSEATSFLTSKRDKITNVFGICTGDVQVGDFVTWLHSHEPTGSNNNYANGTPGRCLVTRGKGMGLELVSPAIIAPRIIITWDDDSGHELYKQLDIY
jgi:hypothetical protein